jgi:hypothetical protein
MPDLPVVRAGRLDLHRRLHNAADEREMIMTWSWSELCYLLREAAQAVVTCPHTDRCAICYHLDREEAT